MKIQQLETDFVLKSLNSGTEGLASSEAARRLREYGENRVQGVQRDPLWLRFFHELTHFFAIIMWLAAALAFFAEWHAPGEGMAKVGYAVITVIFVSAIFSFLQEYRVEKSLEALQNLLPNKVNILRDGMVSDLNVVQLVPGDIVLLEQGNAVPADCRVIEAFALGVNNATITGESMVQLRQAGVCDDDDVMSADNILLAGTVVAAGKGRAVVFATGMNTEFGKIAHLTDTSGDEESPLRHEITHLSRMIAFVAISLGALFFLVGLMVGVPLWQDLLFAIGIIVAMVPEGLLPTLTLALVLAAQRMVKRKVLIRHLPAIETLGSTTVICTDKTGTLTQNRMAVEKILLGERLLDLADIAADASELKQYQAFFACAAWCHDLRTTQSGVWLGDPMEVALHAMAKKYLPDMQHSERLNEIPFDTTRMRLSVVQAMPEGPVLYTKGAPEKLLPLCDRILVNGEIKALAATDQQHVIEMQLAMAEKGLRVLAFAYKPLTDKNKAGGINSSDETGMIFCGLAGLEDPPREEVPTAIRQCHEAGIRIIMITGDHPRTAVAIARKIGLIRGDSPLVITGEQLRLYSDAQLRLALDAEDIVFARVAAEQKMFIVQALKDKKHIVAVTGDGVNDAPALKAAHIGIAMGIGGTDVARAAADMVLLDDNFASIVNGIEEGRAIFSNIRKFLTYILAHNVPELIPYLAFILFRVPLALTPIQILAIDMAADSLTAVGLGAEKPDPDTMKQPPRPLGERLMNPATALRAYCFLGLLESFAAMSAFFFVLLKGGWHYGESLSANNALYIQATTACFAAIVMMQVVNVYMCRSARRSLFSVGLTGNRLIIFGVLLEISVLLFACYTPLGNKLIGTSPLGLDVLIFILPFGLLMIVVEELRKWWSRKNS
jgi:sodium/potassium-transporting ATPase subunit alpha